jgi:hypothetical protein
MLGLQLCGMVGGQVNSGVRSLTLKVKSPAKTCRSLTARGSFSIQLNYHLSGCVAALQGILSAAWRMLRGFSHGGARAFIGIHHVQPNHSFNLTRLSLPFIKIGCWNLSCMVWSAGRLIRAFGCSR